MSIWSGSIRSAGTNATISIVLAVGIGSAASSSSVIGISVPSASSYALPISPVVTSRSSSSQNLRYRMRPPSSRWTWRKEIEWLSVAFTTLIGMLTRPKEMAPFQMDRTCGTFLVVPADAGSR